ncbi:MAG: cytochrome P450, partial [Planctomycetota bacterium]
MANALKFDLARPRLCYRQWMLAGNPAYFFDHLARHCGDFIHYRGLFSFYFVNHPELVKQVLTGTNKTLDKHTVIYDRFREAFGDGLVVAEGEQWTRKRRLMQPMFSPSTIHGFFETLLCAAEKMVAHWETRCHEQTVFDVAHDMEQVTLRIAGEVLFSDGFDDASERIASWTSAINRYSAKPPLPILRQPWFPSRTNLQLKRTLREFHAFIGNLIEQRRQSPQSNDLLTTLLQSQQGEDGKAIGDHEIKEEVLGMIIGGHETSSSALTWIWYELHRNPEAQQRLREEIELVVGKEKLTIDHLPQLTYTRMVVD